MQRKIVCLRPSSHSTDYSVVAEFPTVEKAECVRQKVAELTERRVKQDQEIDWEFPETRRIEKRVIFTTHTDNECTLDDVEKLFQGEGLNVKDYGIYPYYQELEISVVLPKKATMKTWPLVLPAEEASLLKNLLAHCKTYKITHTPENTILKISYQGTGIYLRGQNAFVGIANRITPSALWTINIVYSADERWTKP